ncbi:unnamed protein product [Linum trigynum]|uniref:Uncharacterized protein n=1 Tax=Linum trigynum TaxID=586398 RepID=A0AAV2E7I0_9ROSI
MWRLHGDAHEAPHHKFPKKQQDPGNFTILARIGTQHIENSLANLGASINLMPYKLFRKLHPDELKTTRLSVTFADRSVIIPRGIVEDFLVRAGKFYYPTDFVILDISEDADMPLILGRPLLATAKALIDVNEGILILRDGEEQLTLFIDPKAKNDDVKEMDKNGMIGSGGEPLKANPTITCIPCGDVKQEIEGIKPEGRKKKAWREKMNRVYTQKKDKGKAKTVGQEGHPLELKLGGDKHRYETLADPFSEALCSQA